VARAEGKLDTKVAAKTAPASTNVALTASKSVK
jgi:hypothetical protein